MAKNPRMIALGMWLSILGLALAASDAAADGSIKAAYQAPEHHGTAEYMARKFGYEGGRSQGEGDSRETDTYLSMKGDKAFRDNLEAQGYVLKEAIDDRESGLQAMVITDTLSGEPTIIFRGSDDTGDLVVDFDRSGNIGAAQYDKHRDAFDSWAKKYPGATVTGHSLGSALGQRFIVDNMAAVKEGIFFNAPGIAKVHAHKYADNPNRPPVTLYVGKVEGKSPDLVSELGGQSHLPGRIVEVTKTDLALQSDHLLLDDHRFWMLDQGKGIYFTELDYERYQERRKDSSDRIRDNLDTAGNVLDVTTQIVGGLLGVGTDELRDGVADLVDGYLATGPQEPTGKMITASEQSAGSQTQPETGPAPENTETASTPPAEGTAKLTPDPTRIVISRGSLTGPVLGAGETVANGQTLGFRASLSHLGAAGQPVSANLTWQVFGPGGDAVPRGSKTRTLKREGGWGEALFTLPLAGLKSGRHTVILTHQNTTTPSLQASSRATFEVAQGIAITDMVVDISPGGITPHGVLYPDQAPHLFVHYRLPAGAAGATVALRVTDADSGAEIASRTIDQPREHADARHRTFIRLDPGRVNVGGGATFSATVSVPGGASDTASKDFRVSAYALALHVPRTLVTADGKPFVINVPKQFRRPFKVDIDVKNGLVIHHGKDRLRGTVTGVTDTRTLRSGMTVRVTDAAGRQAAGYAAIKIKPLAQPAAVPKPPPPKVASVSPAAKCRVPKRYLVPSGTVPGDTGKLMYVKIDRKDGEIFTATLTPVSGKGWWARGQAKFTAICQVHRHGWFKIYSAKGKTISQGFYANDVKQ